ncbi:MAG TPA: GNAT family N-acetyltransferase [Puia sp.]|nr:GNAT family N-acetyltransferase [Puia sp.]
MDSTDYNQQPVFSHIEPVLSVQDVSATITYWQEVLGFPTKWTWGDPPNHGAVSWQNIHVQFSLNPEHAISSKGSSVWIRTQRLGALYRFHEERKAEIVAPLENQPWGMAQYTVREINGHYVSFAGFIEDRQASAATLPPAVRITGRNPTLKEYQRLKASVGWGKDADDARTSAILAPVLHAVVAEDTISGGVIGCALLLGDGVSFYYVKDVMVHKDWQGRRVGTALMQELTHWLEKNASDNALVGLFTRETLEPFYKQFGFASGFAMLRYMNR